MTGWPAGLIRFVPLAACCAAAAAQPIEIVSPRTDQILYGSTEVLVSGPVQARYELRVRRGPDRDSEPICVTQGPPEPGACRFDAWSDLSSETVIARVTDGSGALLGERRVQTRELLQPDATIEAPRPIELEASVIGSDAWVDRLVADPGSIECRLARKPCRVRRVERKALRGTLFVAVLIDESASVSAPGLHLGAALRHLGERLRAAADPAAGFDVRFRLTAFAGVTRPLTDGFVTDMRAIESALASVRPLGTTALYRSIATELRSLADRRQRDRLASREVGYALIVISDGNDTSNGLIPGDQLRRLATSGGVPIFCLVLPAGGTEDSFRALGPLSGGASYLATSNPEHLLAGDLFERLRARLRLEIDPTEGVRFSRERGLELRPPAGGTLAYPVMARPEPAQREATLSSADDQTLSEAERVAALQRFGAEGQGVEDAEAVYERLRVAARQRRGSPAWRRAALAAVAELAGHALLWRTTPEFDRLQMLRLLEQMRDEGWFGQTPPELLRAVLNTVLDPDFPATRDLRARVSALQNSL